MIAAIRSFLNDLVTTKDGVSFDPIRVGMIVSFLTLLGLASWDVIVNHSPFNAFTYGSGIGALFAGGGVGIGAKRKDEPDTHPHR